MKKLCNRSSFAKKNNAKEHYNAEPLSYKLNKHQAELSNIASYSSGQTSGIGEGHSEQWHTDMTHNAKFVFVGVGLIRAEKLLLIHVAQRKHNRFSVETK